MPIIYAKCVRSFIFYVYFSVPNSCTFLTAHCYLRKKCIIIRIMRKSPILNALFPKTRQLVLQATLLQPERWWYLSELAQHLGLRPSTLQRELGRLAENGILKKRSDGNRQYYKSNEDCPCLEELQGLLIKTVGVLALLEQVLKPFFKAVNVAFVFGSFATSSELVTSDIDLMIIGTVGLAEIAPAIRNVEKRVNRPVNPVILTSDEAWQKVKSGHHFLKTVRQAKKYFLWGKNSELGQALSSKEDQEAHAEPLGA